MPIINLVYEAPDVEVKEYDFTKSDGGFTYYDKNAYATYGRDSNGFYVTGTPAVVAWRGPSSLYNGTLSKVELELYSDTTNKGGGIAFGRETAYSRAWYGMIDKNRGSYASVSVTIPAGGYTFTIDLDNKECYISTSPNTKQTLTDAEVSSIRGYWGNATLNIIGLSYGSGTSYIQKARFYL